MGRQSLDLLHLLIALPRELRDRIYGEAFIVPSKIYIDENHDTIDLTQSSGEHMYYHRFAGWSNPQIELEAYELLFHRNSFHIEAPSLQRFLSWEISLMSGEKYKPKAAVKDLSIRTDVNGLYALESQLQELFKCQTLLSIEIELSNAWWVDQVAQALLAMRVLAKICIDSASKIGNGLIIKLKISASLVDQKMDDLYRSFTLLERSGQEETWVWCAMQEDEEQIRGMGRKNLDEAIK